MRVKSGGMGNHAALVYRKFFDSSEGKNKKCISIYFYVIIKKRPLYK